MLLAVGVLLVLRINRRVQLEQRERRVWGLPKQLLGFCVDRREIAFLPARRAPREEMGSHVACTPQAKDVRAVQLQRVRDLRDAHVAVVGGFKLSCCACIQVGEPAVERRLHHVTVHERLLLDILSNRRALWGAFVRLIMLFHNLFNGDKIEHGKLKQLVDLVRERVKPGRCGLRAAVQLLRRGIVGHIQDLVDPIHTRNLGRKCLCPIREANPKQFCCEFGKDGKG